MKEANPYDWAVELAPIGVWRTQAGRANILMGSILTLSKDGTGTVEYYSAMFDDETVSVLWQVQKPGELRIFQINEDYPLPEVDTAWDIFTFRATWKELDAGSSPVLMNVNSNRKSFSKSGFWRFDLPVTLESRG